MNKKLKPKEKKATEALVKSKVSPGSKGEYVTDFDSEAPEEQWRFEEFTSTAEDYREEMKRRGLYK